MRILITFKVGDGKGWNHTRHFDLDMADAESLKRDFLGHVNGGIGALGGAAYKCVDPDSGQPYELAIRYEDILYVEFMPHVSGSSENQGQIAGKASITGPLQARLSTSPLQSRTSPSGGGKDGE
jgi:hypothetical protein